MPRRELTDHIVEGQTALVRVFPLDKSADDGSCHQYRVEREDGCVMANINFHQVFQSDAPENAKDLNGLTNESLMAIVLDRLRGFQEGDFACRENAIAIKKLEEALESLKARTRNRIEKGVEGTLVA